MPASSLPRLVVLTGPIASGKNATAEVLVQRTTGRGLRVVLADLDDVAAMVGPPGAATAGLWFAAHQAHGALVGQWARSSVDLVVAVGPIYTVEEQAALTGYLPDLAQVDWVILDAPEAVTLARVQADSTRGLSRDPDFHRAVHARCRTLLPSIPRSLLLDTSAASTEQIVATIEEQLEL